MKTRTVVDSSDQAGYEGVAKTVLSALDHFGVYGDTLDLAASSLTAVELEGVHLLVLAQEGTGDRLGREEAEVVLGAVSRGMGLLVLDGRLENYPPSFLKGAGITLREQTVTEVLRLNPENPVAVLCEDEIGLREPLAGCGLSRFEGWSVLLSGQDGTPRALYGRLGRGRIILFLISPSLWQNRYLGFGEGLDRVFRNGIAWASRKPFVMKPMPPFVTAKFDDVSFTGSRAIRHKETLAGLYWLNELNNFGFIPNLGIFTEDIKDIDGKRFREKEADGMAEFSPHAFVDFRYMEDEDKCPIYLKHNGQEFSSMELEKNFERIDSSFARWGISFAETINAHYQEIGFNSLPFIRQRGQKYLMTPIRLGKAWSDPAAHLWNSPPYGKAGFSLGPVPDDTGFFNVLSIPPRKDVNIPSSDFLYGCTGLHGESPFNNVEKAVKRAVFQVKRGLETGFFGCFMAHEQRIAQLTPDEWSGIVRGIGASLSGIPHEMKSYDHISRYARNRTLSVIEHASCNRDLSVSLKGRSLMEQYLCLLTEEGGRVEEGFLKVPAFEKSIRLNFKI